MKQNESYIDPASFEISIEEFDSLEGEHEFSKEYQKKKKKLLQEYQKRFHCPESAPMQKSWQQRYLF